jgi:LAO/AO transport system kinase
MEIPDVIVVNKRDHELAEAMVTDVRQMLGLVAPRSWEPPVVLTEARRDEGIDELLEQIEAHRAYLESGEELAARRRRNVATEVFAIASARARRELEAAVSADPELNRLLEAVQDRKLDPFTAVNEILEKVFKLDDQDRPDPR